MFALSLPFSQILLLAMLATLLGATVYSGFLLYHWLSYGERRDVVARAIVLYLSGVLIAFLGMTVSIARTL